MKFFTLSALLLTSLSVSWSAHANDSLFACAQECEAYYATKGYARGHAGLTKATCEKYGTNCITSQKVKPVDFN